MNNANYRQVRLGACLAALLSGASLAAVQPPGVDSQGTATVEAFSVPYSP